MEPASKKPGKWTKNMGILGLSLCVLCCTLPIIGIIGGTTLLSIVALYAEKVALVLLIFSAGLFGLWIYKRRQAASCSVACSCKTKISKPESTIV